jgi:CYTH domain-containing protein/5'-deoxynucleotidase YfbR-like HD superfamily hydrolase
MPSQDPNERFPVLEDEGRWRVASELAVIALRASQLTEDFSAVERIPRYADGRRESNVEHSYMLAIAAPEMAKALGLNLDIDKVRRFALSHDLIELKVGDVATFDLTPAQLAEKERLERAAKEELCTELLQLTAEDLREYERQNTPEAVFVRMVDKLLPVAVDITGDGVRVMREDYGVTDQEELKSSHAALHARVAEKFGDDFPDLVAAHAILCKLFEDKYLETVADMKTEERPRNPTEIELKYLVDLDKLPDTIDLNEVKKEHIHQGYIAIGADGSETRVRSYNHERFELTIKSPGMIARDEQTIKLTKEMFDSLWLQTSGRQIVKTRHYIAIDGMTVELDIYEGRLQGLVTAEVEFDGRPTEAMVRATTFEPPEWFGENISEDERFKNHSLAERLPHDPIPLGSKPF